ncbi:MAG: TMEM165/GDT1 family protein [Thermoproteota archaeon]
MSEEIVAAATTIMLAELGDKTMLATAAIGMEYGFTTAIIVSTLAFTASSIAVALGAHHLASLLPLYYLNLASAVLFILMGLLILKGTLKGESAEHESAENDTTSILALMASMMLAELGDKTQMGVFTLALSLNPISTIVGAVLGYFAVNTVSAMVSRIARNVLNQKKAAVASSLIFIVVGLVKLIMSLNQW